jgi:glycosyltransferase involved in cell wall biosynthesis
MEDKELRNAAREKLGLSGDDVVIGTLGNFTRQKGHDLLLQVMQHVLHTYPNMKIRIIGKHMPDRLWYEANVLNKAAELGMEEPTLRFIEAPVNARALLPGLDIFLLSSRGEGIATATLEAMVAALPVVGFNVGSVSEAVLDNESGFLVERFDIEAAAQACCRLIGNADLRSSQGRKGRELALSKFTVEACVSAHAAAYDLACRSVAVQPHERRSNAASATADRYVEN